MCECSGTTHHAGRNPPQMSDWMKDCISVNGFVMPHRTTKRNNAMHIHTYI